MKKIFFLSLVLLLALSAIALTSCKGNVTGNNEEVVPGSLKINVVTEDGDKVLVGVDEDKDLASYVILRSESTVKEYRDAVATVRKNILSKAGTELEIKTNPTGIKKAIVIELDGKMGIDEYSVTKNGDKIYVKAGSAESLSKVTDIFVQYFIYGANKSLLVPAGNGFIYDKNYAIDALTVGGVDIREFRYYLSPENESNIDKVDVHFDVAEIINENLEKAMGVRLETDDVYYSDGNHNIIIKAVNTDVNGYEIKIEGGDIYLIGSFLSVKEAARVFSTELIGFTEGEESGKTVKLTEKDSVSVSMGLTAPYTKDELLSAMEEAYENDEMILSGTHTWDSTMGNTNGTGIGNTERQFTKLGLDAPAILEIEVTKTDRPDDNYTLEQYDLSKLVSEAMAHVSKGGIISICTHFANPYGPERYINGSWYTGHIGGNEGIRKMLTEGTEDNRALRAVMENTLRLIKTLSDNGIPFMLRPFHENNADWFWWCIKNAEDITAESFVSLWKYFYDVVTKELGITEVVWVYSPSTNGGLGDMKADILYPYPGDEYVDIVGMDWYTAGNKEYNANGGYDKLMSTGKPVALCEYGPSHGSDLKVSTVDGSYYYKYTGEDVMDDIKTMLAAGHKIAYFETWTWNGSYIWLEKPEVIVDDPIIYNRSEMMEYWANN